MPIHRARLMLLAASLQGCVALTGEDAGFDASPVTSPDGGADAGLDSGPNSSLDAGTNSSLDGGADAGPSGTCAPPCWKHVPMRTKAQARKFGYLTTHSSPFNSLTTPGLPTGGEGWQKISYIDHARSNPNIVYFVTDTSQVWKSIDGGVSWQRMGNFPAKAGTSLAVDPTNANVVYVAGSVMAYWPEQAGAVEGIFRTTDGGDTWALVKKAHFHRGNDYGVHFAFAGTTLYAAPSTGGILKSTNGGTVWNLLERSGGGHVLDASNLSNIVAHPTNHSLLFCLRHRRTVSGRR